MGGRGASGGGGGGGGGGGTPKQPYQQPLMTGGKPALTGSEKQINWANTIRDSYIAVHGKRFPENTVKDVMTHTDAGYWIKNRYGLGTTNAEQRQIQQLWYKK